MSERSTWQDFNTWPASLDLYVDALMRHQALAYPASHCLLGACRVPREFLPHTIPPCVSLCSFCTREMLHKVLPDMQTWRLPTIPPVAALPESESLHSQKHGSSSMPSTTQNQVVKALWLLPFLCVSAIGAPATSFLRSPTLPAFPAVSELSFTGLFDPSSLPTQVNKTNDPLSAIEHWMYGIPSTTLRLRINAYPPKKIDRRALGQTILQAQARVRRHIEKEGDGELWAEDDRMPHGPCAFPLSFPQIQIALCS